MIPRNLLLLIMLTAICVPINGYTASFDCSKRLSSVERLICDNKDISKLDDTLSSAYHTRLSESSDFERSRREQQSWLKKRNTCRDIKCLRFAYHARLSELTRWDGELKALASRLKLSDYYSKRREQVPPLCFRLLASLKRWDAVKVLVPIATTDSIDDPILSQYLGNCSVRDLIRHVSIEPRVWNENNLDSLSEKEREEYGRKYVMQKGFRLYRANIDNSSNNSKEFILYGGGTISLGADENNTSVDSSYFKVIDLKKCDNSAAAQVTDVINRPHAFVGLLQFENRTYVFDSRYYQKELSYGIHIKQWEYSPKTKLKFFRSVCSFTAKDD